MSLLTNWRSRWPSDFAMEPEQVYRDKEAERAGQLVEQASQEKYGTPDPSFSFSHLSDFVAQAGESAGRRAGLPQYSEANPPPWAEGAASHAPQAAPNITAGDITSGRWGNSGGIAGSIRKGLTDLANMPSGVATDARDAITSGSLGDLKDAVLAPAETLASPITSLDTALGHRISGPVLNSFLDQSGNIDTNPGNLPGNVLSAATQANPVARTIRGTILGQNPYGGDANSAFDRFQASDAPAGLKTAANFATPLAFAGGSEIGGMRAAVGGIAGAGVADQIAANQDAPPIVRTIAPMVGAGIGGIVAHNPSAVLKLGEGGPVTGAPLRVLNKLTGGGFGGSVTEDVSGGGLHAPGLDPVKQRLSETVTAAEQALPDRAAANQALHGQQGSTYREELARLQAAGVDDLTASRVAAQLTEGMRAEVKPARYVINQADVPDLVSRASAEYAAGNINDFEHRRIMDILREADSAPRPLGPQHEIDLFRKTYGLDTVDQLNANGPTFAPKNEYPTMALPGLGPETSAPPMRTVGGSEQLAGEAAAASTDTRGAAGWKPDPLAPNPNATDLSFADAALIDAVPQNVTPAQWDDYWRNLSDQQQSQLRARLDANRAASNASVAQAGETAGSQLNLQLQPSEPSLLNSAPEHGKMAAPVDVFQPGDPIRTPGVSDARPGAEDLTFADPVRTRLRAELGPVKPDPVPLAKAQTAPQRLWTHIADVLNLPMSLRAGIDLSGTLRQGLALGTGNPREFVQAFRTEIKALLSQKNLEDAQRAIREHPDYQLLKASKVHLAMDQVGNGAREEVLASHLPEKIPTWLGGGMIRGGERAYTGFLDTLRANVFYKTLDNMVAREAAGGAPVTIEGRGGLKAVGDVINHGSGRGTGRFLDQVGGFQVHPLFSPRNFLSRPQLISDLVTKSGAAREQAIRQVIGLGGTVVAFDTLAQLTGQGVGINPLGGDFGRARIGNSSIDLSGGLAGTIRTGAQLATGARSVGKGYEDANRMDTLMRFGRGKLSPTFAFVVDNLKGSDYNNAPVDWTALTGPGSAGAELANLGVPMIIPDIITAAKAELGPDTTPEQALTFFAIAAGSILGAGTQSGLSPSESLQEARDAATSKLFPGQKYDDLAGSDKAKVNQDSGVQQMNRAVQESPSSKSGKFNLEFDEEMQRAKNAFTTAGPDGQPQVTDGVGYRHAWQDALKSRNDKLHGAGLDKGGQDSVVNGWYDLYDKPGIQEQLLKKDYSGLDQLQAEYTAAHPEIVDKLAKSVGAHDDAIAQEMRQAAAQAKQYYAIPKYRGLDEATANRADAIIAAASSMTTNGQAASRDDALGKMLRNGKAVNGQPVTMEDITNVHRATTLGTNPERKAFQADPANHWFAVFYKGADETAGDVGPSLTGGSSTLPSLPSLPGGSSSSGGGFRRAGPTPVSPIRR